MLKKIVFIIVILVSFSTNIRSEIVILKNGEKIEGKITNQTRTKIELQKDDGTKIVIEKDKIQKIQFGPTQKEIEEQKQKEEELRRKAEEQRRQEEERLQKLEEEKRRKEEERRKKEEEKKRSQIRKEALEKRHSLEIGYGEGPARIVPSFFKVYDLFFYIFTTGPIFLRSSEEVDFNLSRNSISYNYSSYNNQIYLRFLKNDIEAGFSVAIFNLNASNFKDIYRLELNDTPFQPGYNILLKDSKYNMYNLWFIYNLTRFNIMNHETIFGIEAKIYGLNTEVKQNINYITQYFAEYTFIDFTTEQNSFLSIGPNLRIKKREKNEFIISFLMSSGSAQPLIKYIRINLPNFSISSFSLISIKFNDSIEATGIYYKMRWNYNIYKDYLFFIEYLYNENQYKIGKFTAYIYESNPGSNAPPQILPDFILEILLSGQKRVAIEKNQYLNIGLSYRFNFI